MAKIASHSCLATNWEKTGKITVFWDKWTHLCITGSFCFQKYTFPRTRCTILIRTKGAPFQEWKAYLSSHQMPLFFLKDFYLSCQMFETFLRIKVCGRKWPYPIFSSKLTITHTGIYQLLQISWKCFFFALFSHWSLYGTISLVQCIF